MAQRESERNQEATVYIAGIADEADEALIYELMVQVAPIVVVNLPKDRISQSHQGYGFVEFRTEKDADYAVAIMNGVKLYNKILRVKKATADKQKGIDVGATLFIGNLDPLVDEQTLHDTFSKFGNFIRHPTIIRDEEGISKGYGFILYDDFESSDKALESMNNQYLMNRACTISYAYKKDGKGERHGDASERMLAARAKENGTLPTLETNGVGGGANSIPLNTNRTPAPAPDPVYLNGSALFRM